MTPTNFCYWLQGLLELTPDLKTLNEAQVKMIRDHLGYVFEHKQKEDLAPATSKIDMSDLAKKFGGYRTDSPLGVTVC